MCKNVISCCSLSRAAHPGIIAQSQAQHVDGLKRLDSRDGSAQLAEAEYDLSLKALCCEQSLYHLAEGSPAESRAQVTVTENVCQFVACPDTSPRANFANGVWAAAWPLEPLERPFPFCPVMDFAIPVSRRHKHAELWKARALFLGLAHFPEPLCIHLQRVLDEAKHQPAEKTLNDSTQAGNSQKRVVTGRSCETNLLLRTCQATGAAVMNESHPVARHATALPPGQE